MLPYTEKSEYKMDNLKTNRSIFMSIEMQFDFQNTGAPKRRIAYPLKQC